MKLKTNYTYIILFCIAAIISSCSKDNDLVADPFVVAFENLSANLSNIEVNSDETISLVYSETAISSGTFTVSINSINAVYGVDFVTIPAAENNQIILPISSGEINKSIVFKKLNSALDETTEIEFTISSIEYSNSNIQGNTNFIFNSSASLGGSLAPSLGGPNEGNQVYVDLSSNATTAVQRDSWDLGFYGGDSFRVVINGSIYMATAQLNETNIDVVNEAMVSSLQPQVAVGTFSPSNAAYVDATNGDINGTAISEIAVNDSDNKVYLLNLGYEVGTSTPNPGSVAVAGNPRGWKKIRILRDGDNYKLQYADLDATTHQEVTISKNSDFNFSFFSFNTNSVVNVEPQKTKWDICFSVFTNVLPGAGSYGFSDFVFHNRKGSAVAYRVDTTDFEYDNFQLSNVIEGNFSEDQTTIGSSWRNVFSGTARTDRFYIIKDPNNNIYKLKFLALTNDNGERGYPEFEYELLQ